MNPSDYNLVIAPSDIEGLGVYSLTDIKKGKKICPFVGEEMSYKEFMERYGKEKDLYRGVYRRMPWQKWIVCKDKRNIVSYINDGVYNQEEPYKNCVLKLGYLIACENIPQGQELLLDYGKKYWS